MVSKKPDKDVSVQSVEVTPGYPCAVHWPAGEQGDAEAAQAVGRTGVGEGKNKGPSPPRSLGGAGQLFPGRLPVARSVPVQPGTGTALQELGRSCPSAGDTGHTLLPSPGLLHALGSLCRPACLLWRGGRAVPYLT